MSNSNTQDQPNEYPKTKADVQRAMSLAASLLEGSKPQPHKVEQYFRLLPYDLDVIPWTVTTSLAAMELIEIKIYQGERIGSEEPEFRFGLQIAEESSMVRIGIKKKSEPKREVLYVDKERSVLK